MKSNRENKIHILKVEDNWALPVPDDGDLMNPEDKETDEVFENQNQYEDIDL
jgi:hypothetical protein